LIGKEGIQALMRMATIANLPCYATASIGETYYETDEKGCFYTLAPTCGEPRHPGATNLRDENYARRATTVD